MFRTNHVYYPTFSTILQTNQIAEKSAFGILTPEKSAIWRYYSPLSTVPRSLSIASLTSSKLAGLGIRVSMQEGSWGGLPVNMTISVEGERILITWANSAPDIPDMELSVKIKSWVFGSKRESASSALRAVSTTYPTLSKNHFVKTRMSSLSSTSKIVFI